jgi:orotate phosphoribosyltransferase
VHPTFVILSGTGCSEGSQSLRKIGILSLRQASPTLRYRYVQNDICKTGTHPVKRYDNSCNTSLYSSDFMTQSANLDTQFQRLSEATEALQTGHFQLASGLHSRRFFRCIKLFQRPAEASFLFDALAARFGHDIDSVLGANEAGSILAFEVAKRLGANVAIARQKNHEYQLIDGFTFHPHERVLIVDDVTTTGGTAKQLIQIVKAAQATPVGVGLIATKGLFEVDLSCPVEVLISLQNMDALSPDACPLCQQRIPLTVGTA